MELAEADNLREALRHELEARGISTPETIGDALGMPPDEAIVLLKRDRWKEGEVALLEAVAVRLGMQAPEPGRGC
ncbi:hypothetical protein [Belnapia rosea]|uniref:hypothetical protein n=1 Tax=Belnapia rosea TaxID=938405 RepID=UPI00088E638B|nr:hypothetical protein [Belnapia rosea]SDB74634.1 hypothetical protein SAMN02927895_05336 [Belnapia rosea]